MREKILAYRNIHAGAPICIIANGPSVLKEHWPSISMLKIGLNRAWMIDGCHYYEGEKVHFDYYVMGDTGQFATYIRERGDITRLNPLFTLDNGPDHAIRLHELKSDHRRISLDLTVGVYPNNTVTAMGIQIAMWMGCDPIYIAGLDCKGSHFWGGSDVPEQVWSNQREAMGYIAGIAAWQGTRIYNLNPDSACRAFEYKELP